MDSVQSLPTWAWTLDPQAVAQPACTHTGLGGARAGVCVFAYVEAMCVCMHDW